MEISTSALSAEFMSFSIMSELIEGPLVYIIAVMFEGFLHRSLEFYMTRTAYRAHLQTELQDGSRLTFSFALHSFHLLPSPVHFTRFAFCFFSGFHAIFNLLSSNNDRCSTLWKISITMWYLCYPRKIYFHLLLN